MQLEDFKLRFLAVQVPFDSFLNLRQLLLVFLNALLLQLRKGPMVTIE